MNNPCHNKIPISWTLLASCVSGIVVITGSASKLQRAMKLIAVLLTVGCLQVSAYSGAQVSFSGKDVRLDVVFQAIGKQTGYIFLYSPADLKDTRPVTIDVKNVSIETIMKKCLEGQPLEFTIADKTVFVKRVKQRASYNPSLGLSSPVPIEVFVRVTNEEGDPVAGVTVMIKGTKVATATNSDGTCIIKADPQATLILTAVNIQSIEANINGRRSLDLLVKGKTGKLDEVQVIAYGTTSQRFNVGNVTSVKSEDIQRQAINNPLQALQGRVPGLNVVQQSGIPGAGFKIQIRGQNSINSGNEPLYVIDGVPMKPNLSGFDKGGPNGLAGGPLGDAPSSFFYINPADIESIDILKDADATAIYGSRGANGVVLITTKKGKIGKTQVDISFQSGFGKVPKRIDLLNTPQYLTMRKEAYTNEGTPIPSVGDATNWDLTFWDQARYTDWQRQLIGGSAENVNGRASVSGGNSVMQYLLGAGYNKETTVFPGSFSDQKASVHFSISGNSLNQKLKVSLTGSYLHDNNKLPNGDLTHFIYLAPNAPAPFNTDGSLNWEPHPTEAASTFYNNPYAPLKNVFENTVNNLMSSAAISYRVFSNLEIKTTLGYNRIESDSYVAFPFAAVDPYFWSTSVRTASFGNTTAQSLTVDPQLNYRQSALGGTIDFLAGLSIQQSNSKYQILNAEGFSSDASMKNLMAATFFTPFYGTSQYKYYALFARLNYNIARKYIFSLNARRDASSRFGPGKQYANFASGGIGWIFSQEGFVKNALPFLSFGKLRASYGSAGNDQIGDYKYLEIYNYVIRLYQGERGLLNAGLFNPYYAWEITKKAEGGIELGFLRDRILINASHFRNRSSSQLQQLSLPLYLGPNSNLLGNTPSVVENSGLELVLTFESFKSKNFSWVTSVNTSISRNKLIKNYNPLNTSADISIDKPLGFALLYRSIGVDPSTGLYTFADENGQPTSDPTSAARTVLFNLNFPRYFGGIQNSLVFRQFQVDFLFQFVKQQGRIFLFDNMPGTEFNQPVSALSRWQKNGDISDVQKFAFSNVDALNAYNNARHNSDLAFGDASYIRLRNFSLSWAASQKLVSRIGVRNFKVFIYGQNLLTITKYKGLDPETLSMNSLPPLRVITMGVQIGL